MVNVIGWTPSSRGENPDEVTLSQFTNPFEPGANRQQDYPMIRSGHRCFTDNDFFYLIGGYTTEVRRGGIFKELWAMSLATFEWRRYVTIGELPDTMASFSIVQLSPFSKQILLFGGSGTIFGDSSSKKLYLLTVNNEDCTVTSRLLHPDGDVPFPIYGHSMCRGEFPGKYYVIGGTEGTMFNFNVHALSMKVNPDAKNDEDQYTWHFELATGHLGLPGRYRLETTYDEEKQCLLFLGGGNAAEVFGFESITAMNVSTKQTSTIATTPDPTYGTPPGRRCHTLVRHKRNIIMNGGMGHQRNSRAAFIYGDTWILNLDNYTWKKCAQTIPEPVFFHDAAITKDGWMLVFGGVHGTENTAPRNNILYGYWFDVPSLQRFAIESLRNAYPNMFSGLYCGNLRPSRVIEIVSLFLKAKKWEEKEKAIIEGGKIRFRELPDRTRHYLNDDGHLHLIRHERDGAEMRRRQRELNAVDRERAAAARARAGLGIEANLNVMQQRFNAAIVRFLEVAHNRLPVIGVPIGVDYNGDDRDSGEETDNEGDDDGVNGEVDDEDLGEAIGLEDAEDMEDEENLEEDPVINGEDNMDAMQDFEGILGEILDDVERVMNNRDQ